MATAAQAKQFIKEIAPIIQKYAKQYGYKVASPIIAQACIESAFGTSSLGFRYHNYFGMKCGSSWKGKSVNLATKEEYKPGTLTSIKANFRAYDSMDEGVNGYFVFISSKRYSNLKEATTPKEYLEMIKADGYATSSTYVNTNMSCINKYDLTKYDNLNGVADIISVADSISVRLPVITIGSRGKAVELWQIIAGVKADGIYGDKTNAATKAIQKVHGLEQTGVVDAKTWKAGLNSIK
jgi:peptidoglycan hydrolase-like protein with peptidoglycan-binding domain